MAALVVSPQEYKLRRTNLRAALPDSAVILFAAPDTSRDPRSAMLPDPNFYYLTGWPQPGAVLLLTPDTEILFLPPHDEQVEVAEGRRLAANDPDAGRRTGFGQVLSTDVWEAELRRLSAGVSRVYALKQDSRFEAVRRALPGLEIADATHSLARLRMVKSDTEVALIQHSIDVSIEAHRAAARRIRPGVAEYQVAAAFTGSLLDQGCERPAYRTVVGSGPNSVVLHYSALRRRMDRGETVVIDAGAECSGYAADITRTYPIEGRFTPRQRELYNLVLGAQKAAIAAVKPGESLGPQGAPTKAAKQYLDAHGKPVDGKPLSHYFVHGIGHHVGLEVHDAFVPTEPLAAGNVITIEPGLYLPGEQIGIRIEDMVLVTDTGAKVLTAGLARDLAQMEKAVAR